MRIAIAADEADSQSKIAKRFGHAKYYLLYDLEKNEFEPLLNPGHGEKHEVLFDIAAKGVSTFIVGNVGPGAFETISKINAKVYLARKMTVAEAIEKYGRNELEKLEEPTIKESFEHHH
jgi:predicted Fe-Mo cluster-binding NifX family protein